MSKSEITTLLESDETLQYLLNMAIARAEELTEMVVDDGNGTENTVSDFIHNMSIWLEVNNQ